MSKQALRKKSTVQNTEGRQKGIFYIFKGFIFSMVITLAIIALLSVVCTVFCPMDEAQSAAAVAASILGTLFAGAYISRHIEKNGLINGAVMGVLYAAAVFLTGLLSGRGFKIDIRLAVLCAVSVFGGSLGGVIGINFGGKGRVQKH